MAADFLDAQRLQVFQLVFVFLQRMSADEEAEDFFLGCQSRLLIPVGNVGQLVVMRLGVFLLETRRTGRAGLIPRRAAPSARAPWRGRARSSIERDGRGNPSLHS